MGGAINAVNNLGNLGNGLVSSEFQKVSHYLTSVDQDSWCHMLALGLNELCKIVWIETRFYGASGVHSPLCDSRKYIVELFALSDPEIGRILLQFRWLCSSVSHNFALIFLPNEVGGGVYWIHLVRPSVCRRHCFRSISQVCFGISLSNFICILMVVIGRKKPIDFQRRHFQNGRLAAILDFLVSRLLTLLWLWILTPNFSGTILMYMGRSLMIFSSVIFKMATWRPYWIFRFLDSVGGMVSGA